MKLLQRADKSNAVTFLLVIYIAKKHVVMNPVFESECIENIDRPILLTDTDIYRYRYIGIGIA